MSDPLSIPKRKPHHSCPQHINNKSSFNNNPPPTAPSPSTSPYLYYDNRLSPASIDSCLNISPSPASSNSSTYSTPYHISPISAKDKGKGPARASVSMSRSLSGESSMTPWGSVAERRCSLLSEGFARSEHTVVNMGGEEGGLRLVSLSLFIGFLFSFVFYRLHTSRWSHQDLSNHYDPARYIRLLPSFVIRLSIVKGQKANLDILHIDNMRKSIPRFRLEPRYLPPFLRWRRPRLHCRTRAATRSRPGYFCHG